MQAVRWFLFLRKYIQRKTGEWHPHLHIFGVLENWIDQEALSETWHEITLDSYIVDIRRVRKHKKLGYGEAIAEVCKYALKFGDLSVEKTWEAYMVLKGDRKVGLRLSGSFGLLRGVKMDDEATTDDDLQEDLPYLEMLYKFVFGKHSYYDLVMTRQVEPQANIERMSEEEGTNDRHDMREIERVAKTDEARTERSGAATQGAECATYRPQQGRKKPTGESHLLPGFGFVNESEDGTDIYIILIYSSMLNVGY